MAKRAIVSGATGFIGCHLVPRLIDDGWNVAVVGRESTSNPFGTPLLADTGDVDALGAAVREFEPDTCFHLATNFVAHHKSTDINGLIESNIAFGTRLVDACSTLEDINFVNVGTIWQHYDSAPYSPVSLYAATKQAFTDIAQFFAERTSVKVVNLELSDTYGPGDKRRKLVQLLLERAMSGEELQMSPGDQYIALINIVDAIDALITAAPLASHLAPSFSVPAIETVTLKELVERVNAVVGSPVNVKFGATDYRPREMMTPWHYTTPLPGWKPQIGLDEGLKEMLNELQSGVKTPNE